MIYRSKKPLILSMIVIVSGKNDLLVMSGLFLSPPLTSFEGYTKRSGWLDSRRQGFQMAKFDPFLSLDCARVEGVGAQSKERKASNFAA